MKSFCSIILFSLLNFAAMGQEANLDTVKAELYKVNKVFDSSRYFSFDVLFKSGTDTSFGKFETTVEQGHYMLNRNNYYFKMGEEEFIQTDSFFISLYNNDRVMIATREDPMPPGERFPLRLFLDSIITLYDSAYIIKAGETDSIRYISFVAKNDSLPYSRFSIQYLPVSYFPVSMEFENLSELDTTALPDSLASKVKIKKIRNRLVMEFSNYQFPQSLEVFNSARYFLYDRFRKQYKLTTAYKGYRLMTNGMIENDFDPHRNFLPPPAEDPLP